MATNDIGRVTPIWRGFYSAGATYELNDIVIDTSGSIWWHKSPEVTTGVTPAAGAIWDAVIDMSVFSGVIADAIAQAQAALEAAEGAVAEVTADTERAETAAENAEASALSASESAAGVGALAQAAEAAKTAAQTAASQAAASASSAGTSATSAGSSAQAAEASKTAAQTAASQAAGSAATASGAAAVVEQKKTEALAAIEEKGEEVLESIPEDYTELSGDVGELKTHLTNLSNQVADITGIDGEDITDLSGYMRRYGIINSSNVWNYVGDNRYQYIIIPIVNTGAQLSGTAQAEEGFYYAGFRSYSAPDANGETPEFSTEAGWTGRKSVAAGGSYNVAIPDDVKYLYVCVETNTRDITPASFRLTIPAKIGVIDDITEDVAENASDIAQNADDISNTYDASKRALMENNYILYTGNIIPGKRYNTSGAIVNSSNAAIIEKFTAQHDLVFSKTNDISIERKVIFGDGGSVTVETPNSNPTFYKVQKGQTVGYSIYKSGVTMTREYVLANVTVDLAYENDSGINWVALGDSITQGTYTYMDGGTVANHTDNSKSYCAEIQRITGWNLTNRGNGGAGWMMRDEQNKNIIDDIQDVDFANFNLCSIALGVNDWKGNQPFGTLADTTLNTSVYANMKHTIEYILAQNPNINIVIITPLNCAVYSESTESENWGIGHANSNGKTLEDMFELIVDVCNYYGIKYVDNTHYSVVNRKNIKQILLDDVHPSEEGHKLIGQRLAREIC